MMNCEFCGEPIKDEFGDVKGAIVCPKYLGWYGNEPDPEVARLIEELEKEN